MILSPSVLKRSPLTLILSLVLNNRVGLFSPESTEQNAVEMLSREFGVSGRKVRKKLFGSELRTPLHEFNEEIRSVFLEGYCSNALQLAIFQSCIGPIMRKAPDPNDIIRTHRGSPEELLQKMWAPVNQSASQWLPMMWRTMFLVKTMAALNATFSSSDSYEVGIHDSLPYFGGEINEDFRGRGGPEVLLPRIDHRPFFFSKFLTVLRKLGPASQRALRLDALLEEKDLGLELSTQLESFGDRLYQQPFFVLESEIARHVGGAQKELIGRIDVNLLDSALRGTFGNIPLPVNPLSIYTAIRDWQTKRTLRRELGWALYLVNLADSLPYFEAKHDPLIPSIRCAKLRDDVMYSVIVTLLRHRDRSTIHKISCSSLRNVSVHNVEPYFDFHGQWPTLDGTECARCRPSSITPECCC